MNKEIKIGFFTILAIIILFLGINYLKGIKVFNSNIIHHAKYSNISGLKKGSGLYLNGYQIGLASNINFLENENQNLLVTFSLNVDLDIPKNSVLTISSQDIMGTMAVELTLGNDSILAQNGDTLNSAIKGSLQQEVNAQILPLKLKTEDLIGSIDSVMKIITAVLNKDTRTNLSNSLESLDKTFSLMNETMVKVKNIVDDNDEVVTSIFKNFEKSNNDITNILNNFSQISDDIANSNINSLLSSFKEVSKKINESEGTLGKLVNDQELYLNLQKSSKQLESLIKDIKINPKRYVNFSLIGGSAAYRSDTIK